MFYKAVGRSLPLWEFKEKESAFNPFMLVTSLLFLQRSHSIRPFAEVRYIRGVSVRSTDRQTDRQTETERQTERHTEKHTETERERDRDRETDRARNRQTDREE